MRTQHIQRARPTITPMGLTVLRARLSLRESQAQFAIRLHVTTRTLTNWETGRFEPQPIYRAILERIIAQLRMQGQLLPEETVRQLLRADRPAEEVL